MACALCAGCRVAQHAASPARPPQLKVIKTTGAEPVDAEAGARLKLESRYWQGMGLLASGSEEEGMGLVRDVAEDAASEGISFSPQIEENLARVLSGRRPLGLPFQPPPSPVAAPQPAQETEAAQASAPGPILEPQPVGPSQLPVNEPLLAPQVHLPALSAPGMADRLVSVDFDQVDIRLVLKTISDITGANFLVDEKVGGTVTLMSPTKMPLKDVYKVLEAILEVKECAAVPAAGNVIKIMPRSEAVRQNIPTRVGRDPATIPIDDTIITQIIPLQFLAATDLQSWASATVGAGSKVVALPNTNAIAITGPSSNIHYIATIIQDIDRPGARREISIVPLNHSAAGDVAAQIDDILKDTGKSKQNAGAGGGLLGRLSETKILPEPRTNSLIVVANREDTKAVKDIAEKLDMERPVEAGNIHVVYLQNATADKLVAPLLGTLEAVKQASTAGKEGGAPTQPLRISADTDTNSLIIAASPQDYEIIADIIGKLDIVREQVLIEMCIMEASEDIVKELGIEWASVGEPTNHVRGFGYSNFGLRGKAAAGTLEGLALGAFKAGSDGGIRFAAVLNALENKSGVNLLSKPHVLTSNNQQARILVGENIPFVKQSRVTESDVSTPTAIKTYDFKDVGIELAITPHVSHGGMVRLEIESKFTKLIEGATGLSAETPTTAKREAQTVVSIPSGATVVIGGLMRDDNVDVLHKVPMLGDIPLLGQLFRWKKNTVQKTNLLFFITPTVLTQREDLERMTSGKKAQYQLSPPGMGQ